MTGETRGRGRPRKTEYRYQPGLSEENSVIADWLLRITDSQKNWGFGLCYLYLRNVKGFRFNHKLTCPIK